MKTLLLRLGSAPVGRSRFPVITVLIKIEKINIIRVRPSILSDFSDLETLSLTSLTSLSSWRVGFSSIVSSGVGSG